MFKKIMSNVVGVGVLDDPCFYIIRIFVGADALSPQKIKYVKYKNKLMICSGGH